MLLYCCTVVASDRSPVTDDKMEAGFSLGKDYIALGRDAEHAPSTVGRGNLTRGLTEDSSVTARGQGGRTTHGKGTGLVLTLRPWQSTLLYESIYTMNLRGKSQRFISDEENTLLMLLTELCQSHANANPKNKLGVRKATTLPAKLETAQALHA